MSSPSTFQSNGVPDEIRGLIERGHWQSAKSVETVAPHQYVVIGWNKDDLTEEEFWLVAKTIKQLGREEEWTPPKGFYDSGNRRPMRNNYLYIGEHAYWFTNPGKPMLNREHISVQQQTPTRRVVESQEHTELPDLPAQLSLEVER